MLDKRDIMKRKILYIVYFLLFILSSTYRYPLIAHTQEGLPLYYWKHKHFMNFGDYLSLKVVERIVQQPVLEAGKTFSGKKLLGIGSIISFAKQDDVIWGSGIKREGFDNIAYNFSRIDIRAVRGPLSQKFISQQLGMPCPHIYGDPALLVPYLFPEFKRSKNPKYEYIIIPHYTEQILYPRDQYKNVIYPTEPWNVVIQKILDSKLVISGSLHGIIIAEAFGIPARLLRRVKRLEPLFKYADYYLGTNRDTFEIAFSIEEALAMGGEPPISCNLEQLYKSFPFEFWPHSQFYQPNFD